MMKSLRAWCLLAVTVLSHVNAIRILPDSHRAAADTVLSSILEEQHQQHEQRQQHHEPNEHEMDDGFPQQEQQRRRLTTVDVPFPSSPDDHEVKSLPLMSEGTLSTKHWAGLLPASASGDKYFFYWLFAPDLSQHGEIADSAIPLVIWLNGGPGCSSMDGLFLENGPLRFEQKDGNGNYQLVAAQHSWHKTPAYMLYIDQPVGTGLSFTTSHRYPKNDREVNIDFYHFLQSFLKAHSDKFVTDQKLNRPFYFSGESHAGHFIPSMMAYILDQNDQLAEDGIYVQLHGAAIGNGWVDPFHQYAAAEAAYGHGIIDRAQKAALADKERKCQDDLNNKRYTSATCFNLLDDIVGQSYGSKSNFKVSQYDIRQVESRRGGRAFPPGHKVVEKYLGGKGSAAGMTLTTMNEALAAVHASESRAAGQMYQECTNPPYDALSHQDGLGVVNEVVQVLEHEPASGEGDIRMLFFNGVTDLICNHVGNEVLLEQLPWQHQTDWTKATRTAWKSKSSQAGDKISGYIKEFKNLLYLKVMDSGHMVPMDVPEVALDMMRLFLYGGEGAFQYSPQKLDRSTNTDGQCPSCPTCVTNFTNFDIDELKNAVDRTTSEEEGDADAPAGAATDKTTLYVGLGLGAAFLTLLYGLHRRSKYGNRTSVSTYDLEMRGGTYFDDPDGTSTSNGSISNGSSSNGTSNGHAGDKTSTNFRQR